MTILIVLIFVLGYLTIVFENFIKINKAATALITGVLCWTVYMLGSADKTMVNESLASHLGDLSGILFFLLGAMTIVELIDAHDGFDIITAKITSTNKRKLLWIIGLITFFLSAILDNLTTTIVMVSLLRKLIKNDKTRLFYAGIVVIAANAGGAWSPIGDVTTTMLWMGGQITAYNIILNVLLPSLVCLAAPMLYLSYKLKGTLERPRPAEIKQSDTIPVKHQLIILFSGILILILVPVFKTVTHLPPYMGMLIGLGILWVITELIHGEKDEADKHNLSVVYALRKIDSPSILFFLGILLSIAALEATGVLHDSAAWMSEAVGNEKIIVLLIGLLSSVVDNVPLVAASQGMYSLSQYPQDHFFWEFMAYCTGTGGSVLIIGTAAGIAAMGIEKISFMWYFKKISLLAFIGYIAGAAVYLFLHLFY